jgi:predicted RecB family endonuclease
MVAARHTLPNLDALDPHELKVLILSQHEQLLSKDEQLASRDTEIEHLKLLIAKLRRMQFGRKSEKLDRQIEQLELRLDELQATQVKTQLLHTHRQELRRLQTWRQSQHESRCPSTCRVKCESIRTQLQWPCRMQTSR